MKRITVTEWLEKRGKALLEKERKLKTLRRAKLALRAANIHAAAEKENEKQAEIIDAEFIDSSSPTIHEKNSKGL